jgi:hypothetical protein
MDYGDTGHQALANEWPSTHDLPCMLQDAIDCCNKYGVALMTTGVRHFKH